MRQFIASGGGGFSMEAEDQPSTGILSSQQANATQKSASCSAPAATRILTSHEMIRSGQLMDGYAADDGAAIHFINGEFHTLVTPRSQAQAERVIRVGDGTSEMIIN